MAIKQHKMARPAFHHPACREQAEFACTAGNEIGGVFLQTIAFTCTGKRARFPAWGCQGTKPSDVTLPLAQCNQFNLMGCKQFIREQAHSWAEVGSIRQFKVDQSSP